jgi:hypothetical protein
MCIEAVITSIVDVPSSIVDVPLQTAHTLAMKLMIMVGNTAMVRLQYSNGASDIC